jgi:hypothetical protein
VLLYIIFLIGEIGEFYMGKLINLAGQKFGRLTVIKRAENNSFNRPRWICKCDCGNYSIVSSSHLKSNHTKSCGCLQKEIRILSNINNKNGVIHGKHNTRLYRIYENMKQRCYNSNNKDYKNYGGRGITVCDEWKNDFMNFYNWAMENDYRDDLTIDRINNNGNYESNNCRWVTVKEQANNRRNNHFITYNGKTQSITKWSNELNLSKAMLYYRLNHNWNIEKALITSSIH